jgi:3-deoxy-D-manno-octulosonic-acid transferase
MLSRLYKYATICFIGGGFGDDGVHNVLEAAVYGKPVVFGPEYSKYFEAIALVDNGGGFSVESTLELEKIFNNLFNDTEKYNSASNSAGNYVSDNVGATSIITKYIYENRLLTN